MLLYNNVLSNCTLESMQAEFKGRLAGCVHGRRQAPQDKVETQTFSVGGLHQSNLKVP